MYFVHLVPPFTPHFIIMVKGLLYQWLLLVSVIARMPLSVLSGVGEAGGDHEVCSLPLRALHQDPGVPTLVRLLQYSIYLELYWTALTCNCMWLGDRGT